MKNEVNSLERRLTARGRHLFDPRKTWEPTVEGLLQRELCFALNGLETECALHESQLLSLLRVECYVATELLHMEQRTPRYAVWRWPEREKLQRRLGDLERERRREHVRHAEVRRDRLEALLRALEKHASLSGVT